MIKKSNDLASFVLEEYRQYKENRKKLTEKWNRNWEAFRGIVTGSWRKQWKEGEGIDWRSDSIINITKQKIITCYSHINDIILAGGNIPFTLKLSPSEYHAESEEDLTGLVSGAIEPEKPALPDNQENMETQGLGVQSEVVPDEQGNMPTGEVAGEAVPPEMPIEGTAVAEGAEPETSVMPGEEALAGEEAAGLTSLGGEGGGEGELDLSNLLGEMQGGGGAVAETGAPSEQDMLAKQEQAKLERIKEMKKNLDAMNDIIRSQFETCHADRTLMKHVLALAVFGETYAKHGVAEVTDSEYTVIPNMPHELQFEQSTITKTIQTWEIVPVWGIFRDMETNDLMACHSIIEQRSVSPYWLRNKMGGEFFDDNAIKSVLSAVATKISGSSVVYTKDSESIRPKLRDVEYRKNTISYLERWGRVPRSIVESYERSKNIIGGLMVEPSIGGESDEGDDIECLVCVADNEVVRFVRTSPEDRPYERAVCEDPLDDIGGVGIADNLEPVQKVLNGAVRAFEDNKKLSANVIFAIKERMIASMGDGQSKSITPGMIIQLAEEAKSATDALMAVTIPDVGHNLTEVISMFYNDFADSESMIPKIIQGIEPGKEQTKFEVAQKLERAGKYMGQIIRNIDEGLIEPMVMRFYNYNMNDPELTVGKGNYRVEALGFSCFKDKVTRVAQLYSLLQLLLTNPDIMSQIRMDWLLSEIARAEDIDVEMFVKSEQEIAAEAMQRGEDPRTQAEIAKIQSEAERNKAQATLAASKAKAADSKIITDKAKTINLLRRDRLKGHVDLMQTAQNVRKKK